MDINPFVLLAFLSFPLLSSSFILFHPLSLSATVDGFTSLTGFHHHHHCGGERRREEIEVAMELCEGDLRRGRERRRRRRGRCRGGDVNGVEGDEAHT
ncbi:hypothetical protein F2Q68_00042824 [Brassica cretica]|uniref:Transmembrane protein n=1 Tax=Brassica cretica TaxID=69181 RepID=A0A8S9MHQ2_BRACR|nr:hypothetical protein F2Q68_00042824 [Brassica cretica]